jgi:hypothetical protein
LVNFIKCVTFLLGFMLQPNLRGLHPSVGLLRALHSGRSARPFASPEADNTGVSVRETAEPAALLVVARLVELRGKAFTRQELAAIKDLSEVGQFPCVAG